MSGNTDYTGKSAAELKQFRQNAERVLADPARAKQHAAARAMLENLPPPALSPFAKRRAEGPQSPTDAAIARLTELATTLPLEFDLSPPEGTRQPHRLAAGDGTPKVGGRQRNREVAVDRYLSFKKGKEVAAIGWLRRKEEDAATGGGWYLTSGGSPEDTPHRDDGDAAELAFRETLAELAPRRD